MKKIVTMEIQLEDIKKVTRSLLWGYWPDDAESSFLKDGLKIIWHEFEDAYNAEHYEKELGDIFVRIYEHPDPEDEYTLDRLYDYNVRRDKWIEAQIAADFVNIWNAHFAQYKQCADYLLDRAEILSIEEVE